MRPPFLLAALSALVLNACYSAGDGKAPPLEELYFPTGLALDDVRDADGLPQPPRFLYVASSDFDLQFRSAALVSYDLDLLRALVPRNCVSDADCEGNTVCDVPGVSADASRVPSYFCVDSVTLDPCGALGARDDADRLLYPGRCNSIDPNDPQDGSPSLLVDKVGIGAFATNVIWRKQPVEMDAPVPEFPSRLFLPVRGDATLHWIDLKDGHFHCGQETSDDGISCDDRHRSGESISDNLDQLRQAPEPFALDATADGKYVAITNQTQGSVSLYANDWSFNGGPKLVSVLSGLPQAPVGIAVVPAPVLPTGLTSAPGFLVSYRNAAQIDLLRVRSDADDTGTQLKDYTRFALTRAGTVPITTNSVGFDSRGIVIDDAERVADYEACGCDASKADCAAAPGCLTAVHQPAVYVASRSPSSLLVGALTADVGYLSGTNDLPSFPESIAMQAGPSRVILGMVKVRSALGKETDAFGRYDLERRVFVVCFDSRRIFIYDPKRRVIDSIVNTGRGPYALVVDDVRGLAYVAHFTDSYLSVISLDQRFPQSYATIVASIGAPTPPRTSK